MTAQTEFGRAGGLSDGRLCRRAAVRRVSGAGHRVIPERGLARAAMRGVAKAANVRFGRRFDRAGAGGGEIVL